MGFGDDLFNLKDETELHREGPDQNDLPPLPQLKATRKRAGREQVKQTRAGLDSSVLQVFPSSIIDQLNWVQQDWLVVRLQTYSDRQACLHMGIKFRTLKDWLERNSDFKKAYELVTLDPLNFAAATNRIVMSKVMLEQLHLLQHPSTNVRLKVMEMAMKHAASIAQTEVKRQTNNTQVNVFAQNPSEFLRKTLEMGLLEDERPDNIIEVIGEPEPDYRRLIAGYSEAVREAEVESDRAGEGDEDSGSDEQFFAGFPIMGLAEESVEAVGEGEVLSSSEGETVGSELVSSPESLSPAQLLPKLKHPITL